MVMEAGVRILVVDDDAAVRDSLARTLRFEGYQVDIAPDGRQALDALRAGEPDAVILDVSMPVLDGLQACRQLRADGVLVPVLMLTARDSVGDRVAGLDAGADDYLVKPFALQEVEARLSVLARRGKAAQPRVLQVADLEYNLDTLEVRRAGKLLQLNPTALKILQALMEASPAVVPRMDLETRVWGEELPDSDSLRVHIHGLRAAVDKPFDKALIQTRHGIGYRIADSEPA
jgi:DNA-binding response OmpR family regulator